MSHSIKLDSSIKQLIDSATDPHRGGLPDWQINIEICDYINNASRIKRAQLSYDILYYMIPLIQSKQSAIALCALILFETIIKNCISTHDIVQTFEYMHLLRDSLPLKVRDPSRASSSWFRFKSSTSDVLTIERIDKCLLIIKTLGSTFQNTACSIVYQQLQNNGVVFPELLEDEMAPVLTPVMKSHTTTQNTQNSYNNQQNYSTNSNHNNNNNANVDMTKRIAPSANSIALYNLNISDSTLQSYIDNAIMLLDTVSEYIIQHNSSCGNELRHNDTMIELASIIQSGVSNISNILSNDITDEQYMMDSLQCNDILTTVLHWYNDCCVDTYKPKPYRTNHDATNNTTNNNNKSTTPTIKQPLTQSHKLTPPPSYTTKQQSTNNRSPNNQDERTSSITSNTSSQAPNQPRQVVAYDIDFLTSIPVLPAQHTTSSTYKAVNTMPASSSQSRPTSAQSTRLPKSNSNRSSSSADCDDPFLQLRSNNQQLKHIADDSSNQSNTTTTSGTSDNTSQSTTSTNDKKKRPESIDDFINLALA